MKRLDKDKATCVNRRILVSGKDMLEEPDMHGRRRLNEGICKSKGMCMSNAH